MIEAKKQLGTTLLPYVPAKTPDVEGRDDNRSQQRRKALRSNPKRDLKSGLRGQCQGLKRNLSSSANMHLAEFVRYARVSSSKIDEAIRQRGSHLVHRFED